MLLYDKINTHFATAKYIFILLKCQFLTVAPGNTDVVGPNLKEVGCQAVHPLTKVGLGGGQIAAGVLACYGTSLLQICCLCHHICNSLDSE